MVTLSIHSAAAFALAMPRSMASVVSSIRVAGLWTFRVAFASTRQSNIAVGQPIFRRKNHFRSHLLSSTGSALNVVHAAQSSMDGAARRDGRTFGSGRCVGEMTGRG